MSLTATEQKMLAAIDPARMLAQTLTWAEVNSGTGNMAGLAAMAGLLAKAFAALPGEVSLVAPAAIESVAADGTLRPVPAGQHLVLRVRPDAARRVLLTGHMDTVFGPSDPFQTCRWLDDTTLNGPGTADMKAGIAVMLAGLQAFETSAPTLGYDVMIGADEETGSLASAGLIRALAAGKIAALTYEPALPDGAMAGARPGSGNYSAVVRGRSAHAGRNPQDGRNALVAASDLALRLAEAARPGLSINPSRIDGGGATNVVPDMAVLRFNMRPATPDDAAAAETLLRAAIAAVEAKHEVSVHLHGQVHRPPKVIDAAAEGLFTLVGKAAADLGQPWHRKDTGGVCDGNNIAGCGVPVIDTMGALGGAIHSPDEFLIVPSLAPRAALTALTLHRLSRGDYPQ